MVLLIMMMIKKKGSSNGSFDCDVMIKKKGSSIRLCFNSLFVFSSLSGLLNKIASPKQLLKKEKKKEIFFFNKSKNMRINLSGS
jgi:hypothetical protein